MQRRNFQNFDITMVNNQVFSPLCIQCECHFEVQTWIFLPQFKSHLHKHALIERNELDEKGCCSLLIAHSISNPSIWCYMIVEFTVTYSMVCLSLLGLISSGLIFSFHYHLLRQSHVQHS